MSARTWAPVSFAIFAPRRSLYRQRIRRRADGPGDRQRGRDEHELVGIVRRAVLAEFAEVEDLAHGEAHDGDGDPVPGLIDAWLGLVGPNLVAPGVGGDGGDLITLYPLQRLERQPGSVPARVTVPPSH